MYEVSQFLVRLISVPFFFVGLIIVLSSIFGDIRYKGELKQDVKFKILAFIVGALNIVVGYGLWRI